MAQQDVPAPDLGFADFVCLALMCDGHRHGWAVSTELAPDGRVGRIWSLSRPLTYRAIDRLLEAGLLATTGTERGRGRERRLLAPTRSGRRLAGEWLDTPVAHLRDLRTELLLKLHLRARADRPVGPFVAAQVETIAPILARLEQADTVDDPVALWRREQARAARRFLAALAADDAAAAGAGGGRNGGDEGQRFDDVAGGLRLSARNQLAATVSEIRLGDQVVIVTAAVDAGEHVSAVITRAALDDLDLVEGDRVVMISKAADTVVGVRPGARS